MVQTSGISASGGVSPLIESALDPNVKEIRRPMPTFTAPDLVAGDVAESRFKEIRG
jgi:hypothetical protein